MPFYGLQLYLYREDADGADAVLTVAYLLNLLVLGGKVLFLPVLYRAFVLLGAEAVGAEFAKAWFFSHVFFVLLLLLLAGGAEGANCGSCGGCAGGSRGRGRDQDSELPA